MNLIQEKLVKLENRRTALNDAPSSIAHLSDKIRTSIASAVNSANGTDSVDDRISHLLGGLQAILDQVNTFSENLAKESFVLGAQISVLEELLEEYLELEVVEEQELA